MTGADFDAGAFDRQYAILELLPPSLFDAVVHAFDGGPLRERAHGVIVWLAALREGRVPTFEETRWPNRRLHDLLATTLGSLGLPRWARKDPALVDAIVQQIVQVVGERHGDTEPRLRELERAMLKRVSPQPRPKDKQSIGARELATGLAGARACMAGNTPATAIDPRLQKFVDDCVAIADAADREAIDAAFTSTWAERIRVWESIEEVLGELGALTGIGWDLSSSVLRSVGWLEAAKLARLLKQIPQLSQLVRTLGRLQDATRDDAPSVMQTIFEPVLHTAAELREVSSPQVPHELRGIERSDEIVRMLPSEAVLLADPDLEWLWHARRAERALTVYRVEGTEFERVLVEYVGDQPVQRPKPKPERGPILVCIDTSGSMSGLPETIAKAIALEAARTAHRERRQCLLYAFGGPGEVVEHELSFDAGGIPALLAFLGTSFGGGTDVSAPLVAAAERLSEEQWGRADVVLVSDGEFPVPRSATTQIQHALSRRGARMHGVLIGNVQSAAVQALCDPVHVFSSWGAMLGS